MGSINLVLKQGESLLLDHQKEGKIDIMSWGTELWDKNVELYGHMDGAIQFLQKYVCEFIDKRGKLEAKYARDLKSLVNSYLPKEPRHGLKVIVKHEEFSYMTAYKKMLENLNFVAIQHERISDVSKEMKETLLGKVTKA